MVRKIKLNDLPQYSSDWVKRILGLEKWTTRQKSEAEIIREFEIEKWGSLLEDAKKIHALTLEKVENLHASLESEHAFFHSGEFWVGSRREIEKLQLDLFADVMRPHLSGASALVELGAGYGSKILSLSERDEFSGLKLYAYEFTESGQELIRVLAGAMNKEIEVGYCDFRRLKFEGPQIPSNSIIFTSNSVHYVPELDHAFVSYICQWKPKVVIHFEPCYEHQSLNNLHEMMCRRYIEINDYSRNLVSVIEAGYTEGEISSIETHNNVFGANPFLPISVIKWK